jgi:hypothetical protein
MYCKFCGDYISIFNLQYFCECCSELRRLLLLIGKNNFLEHNKKYYIHMEIKENEEKIEEKNKEKNEEKNEEKIENKNLSMSCYKNAIDKKKD